MFWPGWTTTRNEKFLRNNSCFFFCLVRSLIPIMGLYFFLSFLDRSNLGMSSSSFLPSSQSLFGVWLLQEMCELSVSGMPAASALSEYLLIWPAYLTTLSSLQKYTRTTKRPSFDRPRFLNGINCDIFVTILFLNDSSWQAYLEGSFVCCYCFSLAWLEDRI